MHWTPLRHTCGCVVDWGWDQHCAGPDEFIAWCAGMIKAACPWDGAETGSFEVDAPRTGTICLENDRIQFFARMARGEDIELGRELTRQLLDVQAKVKDPKELRKEIPVKYFKYLLSQGYNPLEQWVRDRQMDIVLNLGDDGVSRAIIDKIPE